MQHRNQTHVQPAEGFAQFGLRNETLAALAKKGFTQPTPIQLLALPIVLKGADLIGQAQTGTGKTAAFGLPVIEDTQGRGVQTLVLAPTRELANQIVDELNSLAHGNKTFKAHAIYGGVGFGNQINALRRGDITCLVACPGRLLDLLQKREVDLRGLRTVVLDEADRMLDMGFIRDIDKIFAYVPKQRQTLLFSATVPPEIRKLAERYLYKPESVRAESGPTATELTDQYRINVRGDKYPVLLALMTKEKPAMSVIFTRTKHGAKKLAKRLADEGYKADALQGNLSQNARDRVMAQFRDGGIDHLVATDVAARGLDVKGITHVINYDFPMVNEDYVHRIGRTGRMGERGRSFLFVEAEEERDAKSVERISGVPIASYDVGPLPRVTLPPLKQPEPGHRQQQRRSQGGHGGGHRGASRPSNGGGGGRSGGYGGGSGGSDGSGGGRSRPAAQGQRRGGSSPPRRQW